jgi:hypothetical protein
VEICSALTDGVVEASRKKAPRAERNRKQIVLGRGEVTVRSFGDIVSEKAINFPAGK